MADITKCQGNGCPIRYKCYRYTAKSGEMQSFFVEEPYEIGDGKFCCKMFWGEKEQGIFQQLKDITNGNF